MSSNLWNRDETLATDNALAIAINKLAIADNAAAIVINIQDISDNTDDITTNASGISAIVAGTQNLTALTVLGSTILAQDGGNAIVGTATDIGGRLQIDGLINAASGPADTENELLRISRQGSGSRYHSLYTYNGSTGNYLALRLHDGVTTTSQKEVIRFNQDGALQVAGKTTVSSGGLEIVGTLGSVICNATGAVLSFSRPNESYFSASSTGGYFGVFTNGRSTGTNSNANFLFSADKTNTSVGDLYTPGGVVLAISDQRLKENIKAVKNPIDKACKLAKCVRSYNYVDSMNITDRRKTQYIAQLLEDNGFEGHIIEREPFNEAQGTMLGWEYADKEIIELVRDENGVKQEITGTERVVVKEGALLKTVEQNFAPYAFPAIAALNKKIEKLEKTIKRIEKKEEKQNGRN